MRRKHRKGSKKPLTEQMKLAALLLFDGQKIGHIAALLGINRVTLWRWGNRKDFQREIDKINDLYVREMRKEIRRQIRESPEYKRMLAARRKLPGLGKKLEEAGNSGDMNAYGQAAAAYDKCFDQAYGVCLKALDRPNQSQNFTRTKKQANQSSAKLSRRTNPATKRL